MIFWGIVLLVIGLILWAIGRAAAPASGLTVVGYVVAAIGGVLLALGVIFYAIGSPRTDVREGPHAPAHAAQAR